MTTHLYNRLKVNRLIGCNRLKESYKSHKDLHSQYLAEKLVRKGLKLEPKPTLDNHDQKFIENWYMKLNKFSLN